MTMTFSYVAKILSLFSVALACFLFTTGCGRGDYDAQASAVPAERVTNVAVYLLRPDTLVQYSRMPATTIAWRDVTVGFREGGAVVEVFKELGDIVKAGEPLARLDTELLNAALVEARAGSKLYRYNYERSKQLYDEGTISEQDLYSAEYDLKRAESTLLTLRERLKNAVLRAPYGGEVADRRIELGQTVQQGNAAFRLVQTKKVKLRAWVPENQIADFSEGDRVEAVFDAYPTQTFSGVVGRIGPAAESSQRVFPMEVHLTNTEGRIRVGMVGKLNVARRTLTGVVVIPREAVVERDTGPVAFVVNDGVAHMRILKLGAAEEDRVIVQDGLILGEQIVVKGGRDLIDGDRVIIQEVIER